ncbi:hypothetical protein [Lacticaseibacillus sp. GG6-2]
MSTDMQMIFGSLDFLKAYQTRAKHPLLLLRPLTGGNFALLDASGRQKFAMPQRLQVLTASGELQRSGFVQLRYFHLTPEDGPVFVDAAKRIVENQATITNNQYAGVMRTTGKNAAEVLLTQWQTTTAEGAARKTPAFVTLEEFAQRAAAGAGYHEAFYQVVKPKVDR